VKEYVTYDEACAAAYASTLAALDRAGLDAEFIDTGGSCKAIWIAGTHDGQGAHRAFQGGPYAGIMLTSGGPLTDERDASLNWEGGIYDGGGDQVATLLLDYLYDAPDQDDQLAEDMRKLAEVIR
jgi:hypothetical protein